MACNYNIKVVEGNKFALVMPLKRRSYVSSVPIDEDIDATELVDCHVTIGGVEYTPAFGSEGVRVIVPATLARGTYDVVLTAMYHGAEIRAAYFEGLTIVKWNGQSDAQQYVQGTTVELVPAFVIGGTLTDAELEQLKAQLRLDIAAAEAAKEAAEAAKEAYDEKAEALDDIAQQTTLTQGISDIREDIAGITIDTSTLAKQGTNANATLTETQAQATSAATDAAAAKNGVVDGNDTAVGVAKEVRSELGTGSDTASETGTLFAVVKWAKDKIKDVYTALTDGTNGLAAIKSEATAAKTAAQSAETTAQGTANKNEILAAITANAGVPTLTIPNTTLAQELAPNTLYTFESRTNNLTLTLGTPIVGKASEYHLFLVAGAAITVTWPSSISWNGGSAPTITAGNTYEVSILDGVAAFIEVEPLS